MKTAKHENNFGIGETVPSALGTANRRVLREHAEAAALSKIADVVQERQRRSEKLRRMRLQNQEKPEGF